METDKGVLLFGGTFDPIHYGHLIVSRAAAEQLGVDKVILIPSAIPPHKSSRQVSAARHRLQMTQRAVEYDALFEVSDCELRRDGPSYTLDTVRYFRKKHETPILLYWLIGADSIMELISWYKVKELIEECTIVTAARGDEANTQLEAFRGFLETNQINKLKEYILDTPRIDISSTEIRRRLDKGLPVNYLVPPAVEQYIVQQGLYKSGA